MMRTDRRRPLPRRRPAAEALEGRQLLAVTFGKAETITVGRSEQVAVGDLTGNGRDDLVIDEEGTNPGVYVYLSNPNGTFAAPIKVVPFSLLGAGFALGDVTGDGKLDLVFGGRAGGSIEVLPGKGNGTFGAPVITPTGAATTVPKFPKVPDVVHIDGVADFNRDGRQDVLFTADNGSGVALGRATGAVTPVLQTFGGIAPPVIGDFNGDGKPDLAVPGYIPPADTPPDDVTGGIRLGRGDGTFGPLDYSSFTTRVGIIPQLVADFNGDGKPDLLFADVAGQGSGAGGTTSSVALGRGDGTFGTPIPAFNWSGSAPIAAAGDFNGDGKADLIAVTLGNLGGASPGLGLFLLAGNGDGTFQAPVPAGPAVAYGTTVVAGDFRGDGKTDLVTSLETDTPHGPGPSTVSVLLNTTLAVSGHLDPASDTGASKTDLITADTTPTFDGRSTPGARITLLAHRVGVPGFVAVATTTAGADGTWRATTSPLHPGPYLINAQAVAAGQTVTSAIVAQPRPLQIQAAPPEITAATLDPLKGRLTITFRATGPGGLDLAALTASGAIALSPGLGRNPALAILTLDLSPQSGQDGTQTLTVTFGNGRPLPPNSYTLLIRSAVVRSVAGLALDGEYLGRLPTGNGRIGGDFAARFLVAAGETSSGPIAV